MSYKILSCAEWGARPPRSRISSAGRPKRAIFHHTAGHASGLGLDAAKAYARSIQNFHMDKNGWYDSGHNFLVTRGGVILEGRHGSVDAVSRGKMVSSAHCPGQNDQPGVEIEHMGNEEMTPVQWDAAVWLFAWICRKTGVQASNIYGHRQFYATSCPSDVLFRELPKFRNAVAVAMGPPPEESKAWWAKYLPKSKADRVRFFAALREYARRLGKRG